MKEQEHRSHHATADWYRTNKTDVVRGLTPNGARAIAYSVRSGSISSPVNYRDFS
jgi:hypothetical protein